MRVAVFVLVFVFIAATAVGGAAAQSPDGLSISVTHDSDTVSVEVTDLNGEPVRNANVTIETIGGETELDGVYTTNYRGTVVLDGDTIENLSGVNTFRFIARRGNLTQRFITTITRPLNIEQAPIGQKLSLGLKQSIASTRGKMEGRIEVMELEAENEVNQVSSLVSMVNSLQNDILESQATRESTEIRFVTGNLGANDYYDSLIRTTTRIELKRYQLRESVNRLNGYSNQTLRRNGLDPQKIRDFKDKIESEDEIEAKHSFSLGD